MSSIKDKLTQSVRTARNNPPATKAGAAPRSAAVATRKPAAKEEAPKPVLAAAENPRPSTADGGGEPPHSAGALFPQRIWPD